LRLALAGELDALVADRVRVDPVVVERHRQVVATLLDRLALVPSLDELGDQADDVVDRDLVEPPLGEAGVEDAAERAPQGKW
jgi:hypothetical protein